MAETGGQSRARAVAAELVDAVDARAAAFVVAAVVAATSALSLLALAGVALDVFDPLARGEHPIQPAHPGDRWLTVPALLTGSFLLVAAALARALARARQTRGWIGGSGALVVAGVMELTAFDRRLTAADPAPADLLVALGFLKLVLAAMVTVQLLRVVQRERPRQRDARPPLEVLLDAIAAVELRRAAAFAAAVILLVGVLGSLVRYAVLPLPLLDVNAEGAIPAYLSGALLVAAAVLAELSFRFRPSDGYSRTWWRILVALLAFMAVDEVLSVHERLQYWTGRQGQLSLLPLVALAAIAWVVTLRRLREPSLRALVVAGLSAWLASQIVDVVQFTGRLDALSVPEEMLELTGSALFVLAFLGSAREAATSYRAKRSPNASASIASNSDGITPSTVA